MSEFKVKLEWNPDSEDFSYKNYTRTHQWIFGGGSEITASAAPEYLGKAEFVNPEEAFAASLSSCHLLTFLAIASFNIFFSLSMLAIDKRKDIAMLFALGAHQRTVKSIFLLEGVIIALIGAGSGIIGAVIVCWVQQTFGIVSMGMQTAIVDAYPVKMEVSDFLFTALSISLITFLASYRPAIIAARTDVKDFLLSDYFS